jgi:hypothetical protein
VAAVPLSGPLRAFDRLRALRRLVKVAGAEKRSSQPNRETGLTGSCNNDRERDAKRCLAPIMRES